MKPRTLLAASLAFALFGTATSVQAQPQPSSDDGFLMLAQQQYVERVRMMDRTHARDTAARSGSGYRMMAGGEYMHSGEHRGGMDSYAERQTYRQQERREMMEMAQERRMTVEDIEKMPSTAAGPAEKEGMDDEMGNRGMEREGRHSPRGNW